MLYVAIDLGTWRSHRVRDFHLPEIPQLTSSSGRILQHLTISKYSFRSSFIVAPYSSGALTPYPMTEPSSSPSLYRQGVEHPSYVLYYVLVKLLS